VSGYFSGDGQERKLAYFERLDRALHPLGFELVLFNLAPHPIDTSCRHRSMDHVVPYSYFLGRVGAIDPVALIEPLREAAALEAADLDRAPSQAARKIAYFWRHANRIVHEVEPVLGILWHQFNSQHYALAELYRQLGVPVRFVEYGVLPGTISIDAEGQMAESWVARDSARFRELPVDETLAERVEAYLDTCRVERRTRKPQTTRPGIVERIRAVRERGARVILYAGENVTRTGIFPRGYPRATVHSPHFTDTSDALTALCAVASKRGWHVVFKPHPMAGRVVPEPDDSEVFTLAEGADIFDLIGACDVGTTLVSQACYLLLLHEKPCVLMGRGPLSEKGAAYDLRSREELEETFARALDNGFTSPQRAAWRRHAAQLCEHYLFAMDPDAEEAFGRGPHVAAETIAEVCLERFPGDARHPEPFPVETPRRLARRVDRSFRRWFFVSRLGGALAARMPRVIRAVIRGGNRWF